MSAELKNEKNISIRLIEGSKGIFDVKQNGQLIFSKAKVGRFPNEGEVKTLLGQN